MSSKKDDNDFLKRDTLSLFGDEGRSTCTVAEAKAYGRSLTRNRWLRALLFGGPIAVILIVSLVWYLRSSHLKEQEEIRKEQEEMINPTRNHITMGNPNARMVIQIQGTDDDSLPGNVSFLLSHAVGIKPSEVYVTKEYSGAMSPKPLPFSMIINGKSVLETVDAQGNPVTLELSNLWPGDGELLMKAFCEEWNSLYPEAQYPLDFKLPTKEDVSEIEKAAAAKEEAKQKRYEDLPLPEIHPSTSPQK